MAARAVDFSGGQLLRLVDLVLTRLHSMHEMSGVDVVVVEIGKGGNERWS